MSQQGGLLYAIRAEGTSLVKIGYTRGPIEKRVKVLQTGQPFPLQVIATLPVESDVRQKEALLHAFLASERRRGEWFEVALPSNDLAALLERAIAFGRTIEQGHRARSRKRPLFDVEKLRIIAGRVQQRREQLGWSRTTLARSAGMSTWRVSSIEAASIDIQGKTVHRLAKALDVHIAYLFGDSPDSTCPYFPPIDLGWITLKSGMVFRDRLHCCPVCDPDADLTDAIPRPTPARRGRPRQEDT